MISNFAHNRYQILQILLSNKMIEMDLHSPTQQIETARTSSPRVFHVTTVNGRVPGIAAAPRILFSNEKLPVNVDVLICCCLIIDLKGGNSFCSYGLGRKAGTFGIGRVENEADTQIPLCAEYWG